jgi:hypothetical protein
MTGAVFCGGCKSLPPQISSGIEPAITEGDLRTRLAVFADDSMLGRSAVSGGQDRAVQYLVTEVTRLGLKPAGDNGTYLQTFNILERKLDSSSRLMVGNTVLRPVTDFKVFPFGRGSVRPIAGGQVIYGGIVGDSSTQISEQQAANKIVLLGVPTGMTAERVYANVIYGPQSRFRNAVAVLIASLDYLPPTQRGITSAVALADTIEPPANTHPTSILVSRTAAQLLLGTDIEHAVAGTMGQTVRGVLRVEEKLHPTSNVVGSLPGSEPSLREQYVALGAHSDHLGIASSVLEHDSVRAYSLERLKLQRVGQQALGSIVVNVDSLRKIRPPRPDSIYNGADDDGSGSVALLEIAERLAATGAQPKRSILFVWHAAEEMGLLGSRWYTEHPTVPLDSIVAQLNLDMVGRGAVEDLSGGGPSYLQVIGANRRSAALQEVVARVNASSEHPFMLVESDPNGLFCRSDHWNYARFGIPIAFFTTGLHADYHQVTDEPQYIDYVKLQRVTQFIANVTVSLGNSRERFEPLGPRSKFAAFCSG